jgi:hypothetical protein
MPIKRWLGRATSMLLASPRVTVCTVCIVCANACGCGAPPSTTRAEQSSETSVDAGMSATPRAGDDGGDRGNRWGRADADVPRESGVRYDARAPDANADPTAYTLGSVQCGEHAACGTSKPVCCAGGGNVCRSFIDRCASSDTAVSCDGPEDCALGEVCCASGSRVACDPEGASHCPEAPDTHATIVCHTNADCTSAAPMCDREVNVVLALLTCHRTCTSDAQCEAAGLHYCYVAAGSRSGDALCHSSPR